MRPFDLDKVLVPALVLILGGLFGAVIWPTHERSRENARDIKEFRKEVYFVNRAHLREHREIWRERVKIIEHWGRERELSPAETRSLDQAKSQLDMWTQRVENYIEENKHMGAK